MSILASWMMRLYPARWRARYGDELNALLSDTGADARIVGDLFRGGMRMQMKTWPFLKLAFVLGLVGLLLGTGIAQLLPSEYASRATLQIQPSHIDESTPRADMADSLNERIQQLQTGIMSRTQLSRIILNLGLYPDLAAKGLADDAVEDMRRNITVSFVAMPGALGKRASAFDIKFTYPDRFKAQQTVTALVSAFEEQNQKQQVTGPEAGGTTLLITDAPNLPRNPSSPRWPNVFLAAFLAGVAIAAIWRIAYPKGLIRRRFTPVALAMGIAALAVVGIAIPLDIWPSQYQSTGTLNIRNSNHAQVSMLTTEIVSRTSLSTIINGPRFQLYKDETRTLPLESVIDLMRRHLSITRTSSIDGNYIHVAFEYPDRYKAQQTVSELMNRFAHAGMQLHSGASPIKKAGVVLDVLDNASLPESPTKPNRYLIAFTGGVAGILLAAAISLVRRRWKPEPGFPIGIVPE